MTYRTVHGNIIDTTPTTNTKKAGLFLGIEFNNFECLYNSVSVIKSNGSVGCFVISADKVVYENYVTNRDIEIITEILEKNNVEYRVEYTDEIFFENWEIIIK